MHANLNTKQPPNKHIMALITFIVLVPLVYFIPYVIAQFLPAIKWVNVVVAVAIIVPIISYVVMPIADSFLSNKKSL